MVTETASKIKSKPEFAALSNRGKLGNFLDSYPDYDAYLASGYEGYTTIRSRTPGSQHFRSVVEPGKVADVLFVMALEGATKSDLYIQQVPHPMSERRIQFEVMRDDRNYLELYYEEATIAPLRGIRDRGFHVNGARAAHVLRSTLYEDSFETIQELWDVYPTSIIEATEFSRACGALNKHLIVWEVRDF